MAHQRRLFIIYSHSVCVSWIHFFLNNSLGSCLSINPSHRCIVSVDAPQLLPPFLWPLRVTITTGVSRTGADGFVFSLTPSVRARPSPVSAYFYDSSELFTSGLLLRSASPRVPENPSGWDRWSHFLHFPPVKWRVPELPHTHRWITPRNNFFWSELLKALPMEQSAPLIRPLCWSSEVNSLKFSREFSLCSLRLQNIGKNWQCNFFFLPCDLYCDMKKYRNYWLE